MKHQHSASCLAAALAAERFRPRHGRLAHVGRDTRSQHGVQHEEPARSTWDVASKKNIKWVAALGSQTYGNPVVAGGMVFIGTNNEGAARSQSSPAIAAC